MADLPRRSLLAGCAGAATLTLAGCGTATPGGDGRDAGGTPGLRALRLSVAGGFTSAAIAFRTLPELTLTPDGQVLTPDPVPEIYPGPLLLHLSARDLDAVGREALADVVVDSGLVTTPPPDFGTPGVADAPTTSLRVTLDGTETTLSADALVEAGAASGLTAEQERARESFRALVVRLRDLEATVGAEHLGEPVPYGPEGVWLRTFQAPTERSPEAPEPEVLPWPVGEVDLADLGTPTLVEGATARAVLAALEGHTELTWFRDPAGSPRGTVYEVLARPSLPGDP